MKASEVLWDLFDLAITGVAGVARRVTLMEKPRPSPPPPGVSEEMWARAEAGRTYLRALLRLTLFCLGLPVPILAAGLWSGVGWLVASVGIFWAVCTLGLLIVGTPVGMLIEAILGGLKGIGPRYVRFSLGVLLVELVFTLFVSVVPVQNNPAALPVVILASAILGIMGALGAGMPVARKLVVALVMLVFILFTLSFFFPQTFRSVSAWGSRLDLQLAEEVKTPGSAKKSSGAGPEVLGSTEHASKSEIAKTGPRQPSGSQADAVRSGSLRKKPGPAPRPPSSVRVRRMVGTAYSYSKGRWAIVDPLVGRLSGNGYYPHAHLVFWSGLISGRAGIVWDGSCKVLPRCLSVVISNLMVGSSSILSEFYVDIGVGYDVLLENAVFADYTMAKTLILFRTFSGDSPPARIEKEYEIREVEVRQEQPYLISGEWTGSFESKQKEGRPSVTVLVARFIQDGNRFEGVILETTRDGQKDPGVTRARSRVQGLIVEGRVTFVKTYKEQLVGISYVASYVRGVESLEGVWHSGVDRGRWNMVRRGPFEGSPEDILSVDVAHP